MRYRTIFAASALPSTQARAVVALLLLCRSSKHWSAGRRPNVYETARNAIKRRFKRALVRVLDFAKHETLRKLHRHMHSHRPLRAAEAQDETPHPDASRIAFDPDELRQDLFRMLETQLPGAMSAAVESTLGALGYDDPWKLPAQATLDMVAARKNLISGLSDELFKDVQRELSAGLNAGESADQLAVRISRVWDQISLERADLIAETETSAAYGFASDAAARQAGIQYKQWIHSGLPKVPRPDHLAIDGLIVPMDEAFPVGDPPLRYPHDPDGAAEDVINCGCISVPATEEDYLNQ